MILHFHSKFPLHEASYLIWQNKKLQKSERDKRSDEYFMYLFISIIYEIIQTLHSGRVSNRWRTVHQASRVWPWWRSRRWRRRAWNVLRGWRRGWTRLWVSIRNIFLDYPSRDSSSTCSEPKRICKEEKRNSKRKKQWNWSSLTKNSLILPDTNRILVDARRTRQQRTRHDLFMFPNSDDGRGDAGVASYLYMIMRLCFLSFFLSFLEAALIPIDFKVALLVW